MQPVPSKSDSTQPIARCYYSIWEREIDICYNDYENSYSIVSD